MEAELCGGDDEREEEANDGLAGQGRCQSTTGSERVEAGDAGLAVELEDRVDAEGGGGGEASARRAFFLASREGTVAENALPLRRARWGQEHEHGMLEQSLPDGWACCVAKHNQDRIHHYW